MIRDYLINLAITMYLLTWVCFPFLYSQFISNQDPQMEERKGKREYYTDLWYHCGFLFENLIPFVLGR